MLVDFEVARSEDDNHGTKFRTFKQNLPSSRCLVCRSVKNRFDVGPPFALGQTEALSKTGRLKGARGL